MPASVKQKLQKHRACIIEDVYVDDILHLMIQEGVINLAMKDEIKSIPIRRKQTEAFLDRLQTRGEAGFYVFLDALKITYPHIYELLNAPEQTGMTT